MDKFTGLVQALVPCYFAGASYKRGDVFQVENITLWDDDPYQAVLFDSVSEEPVQGAAPRLVSHYRPAPVNVYPAATRASGYSTGLRS
jgi:hypothetical protein